MGYYFAAEPSREMKAEYASIAVTGEDILRAQTRIWVSGSYV
jgi:hypothetical protein